MRRSALPAARPTGATPPAIPEAFVAWLWAGRRLQPTMRTTDGRALAVIYPGWRAGSWGPDYRGALLLLDGSVVRGDVEVHVRERDWHLHGHGADPAYDSTALHVVYHAERALPVVRPDGTVVPTVALAEWLAQPLGLLRARWEAAPGAQSEPAACRTTAEAIPLLERAGLDRFAAKSARFEGDLACVDPLQALWAGLLETLGYAWNSAPFRKLADRMPAGEATAIAQLDGPQALLAILLGEAGLLGCQRGRFPLDRFTEAVEQRWRATGRTGPSPPLGWRWMGSRPGNGPVRRVAAAAALALDSGRWPLVEPIQVALQELPPVRAASALRRLLVREGDDYWRRHSDLGRPMARPAALLGGGRAADAVVNAVLPWAAALGRARGDLALAEAAEAAYRAHPPLASNQVVRHMSQQVVGAHPGGALASACRQQGLIHLYRHWCDRRDCDACPAGPGPSGPW